jgi:hypothetical protein
MSELTLLAERLARRLPGLKNEELAGWLTESALLHGYSAVVQVPAKRETMVMLYARYLGLQAKASETAENARLNIKGLGIDKSGASASYNALIKEALRDYQREAGRCGGGIAAKVSSGTAIRKNGR